MQRAHKRKIKVLVVDAAMMFAAVQMTVCMHGKQRYTASAQDVSGYEVSIEDNTQTITTEEPQETFKTEYTSTIMNEEINADDAYMLCKIAMAEAEGEDVEGKALVMLVVLNRTKAEGFPDTVSEVIYEKGQFTPVANGRFQKVEPNKECFEALQMIVSEKWDGSLGATYFESESSSTWHRDNLNYLYSHGGHTIVQRGTPLAKKTDKLVLGNRVFYVVAVDDTGGLGISTLYYVEERDDIKNDTRTGS